MVQENEMPLRDFIKQTVYQTSLSATNDKIVMDVSTQTIASVKVHTVD